MKRVLVIDDFFGRAMSSGRNPERESLCRRLGLRDFGEKPKPKSADREPIGAVVFFRGQTPITANIGDVVENDLDACLQAARVGAPDGEPWDLLILDLCFYTGEVTEASNASFAGFPEGRPEDDDPDVFFGLEILAAVKDELPALPIVIFSAHSGEKVQRQVLDLGALCFIARDDPAARAALVKVLTTLDQPLDQGSAMRDSRAFLAAARALPAPAMSELRSLLPLLKELEAVLLQRALHAALVRHQDQQGVSLLPALRLLTGQNDMTTSQAADCVKRLVHQTRPHEALLLADPLIQRAYEMSNRLRPGASGARHREDD